MNFDRTQKRRRRNPNTLSVAQVAKLTGFSHNAVLYWIRKKQLPAWFDGYSYSVTPNNLKKFLAKYYAENVDDD